MDGALYLGLITAFSPPTPAIESCCIGLVENYVGKGNRIDTPRYEDIPLTSGIEPKSHIEAPQPFPHVLARASPTGDLLSVCSSE